MKLVDGSSWIHALRRRGDATVAGRVRRLVETGDAAWCPPVRLELWSGAGDDADRRILRDFEQTLPELPVSEEVWTAAYALANRCRKAGRTAPAIDVLIASCARYHGVELEHDDSHFEFLMTL
jgi:predicted nucleic acid-binding protein